MRTSMKTIYDSKACVVFMFRIFIVLDLGLQNCRLLRHGRLSEHLLNSFS